MMDFTNAEPAKQWDFYFFALASFQCDLTKIIGKENAKTIIDGIQEALDTGMEKYLGPLCFDGE